MHGKVTIVADAGSTWLGKKEYGFELIRVAKEAKVDAIKFQLFEGEPYKSNGNIELPFELFNEFYYYGQEIGVPVCASVFNQKAYEFVLGLPTIHHIKFGYSMRKSPLVDASITIGRRTVVTCGVMDAHEVNKDAIKLFTVIDSQGPLYPNTQMTNFHGLIPDIFQGFSDHSMDYTESQKAVKAGAIWIEKHMTLDYFDKNEVPDGRFALTPERLKEFVWKVKT